MTLTITHSQAQIAEHIRSIQSQDFFGTITSDLVEALDFDHAAEFLKPDATKEDWDRLGFPKTPEQLLSDASEYLEFAIDKADNHRGLSAARSVDHYRAWVWLFAPDAYDDFVNEPYTNYGVPQLRAAATALGFEERWLRLVAERPGIIRMADGLECRVDGCEEGCGS